MIALAAASAARCTSAGPGAAWPVSAAAKRPRGAGPSGGAGLSDVAVTRETLDKIIADCEYEEDREGSGSSRPSPRRGAAPYSLGWGFATQIVREGSDQ
jgi:hypothetical protein